jgi:hypothetical protein
MTNDVRENRLRRMAKRHGLELVKSRRRDPRALDFGTYQLVGASEAGTTLEEIEKYLTRTV